MITVSLIYLGVPTFLIAVLLFNRQTTKLNWLLFVMLSGLGILFIATIARWEIVSIYFKPFFIILYVVACIVSYKRIKRPLKPKNRIASLIIISINIIVICFMSIMSFLALRGYRTPDNPIELSSPLKNGEYIVLHGGSRPMINAHFNGSAQNYAIDIVGVNKFGMRATSINGGTNLKDYVIYGKPVYSPCIGKVLIVVDEFDDLTPPNTDTNHIAGNHILIEYEDKEILLAHLKKGSIKVKVGDLVDTNTIIGQVGNTGNTSEPHLHMHVEFGGDANTILNGTGVPFTINDHFYLRGDIIE